MASPISRIRRSLPFSSSSRNPSTTGTGFGSSTGSSNVSASSKAASLDSTGFTRNFKIFSLSPSVKSPVNAYTKAQRTFAPSRPVTTARHCSAESARWSYWPGKNSTAMTISPCGNSFCTVSTGGSEKTAATAFS